MLKLSNQIGFPPNVGELVYPEQGVEINNEQLFGVFCGCTWDDTLKSDQVKGNWSRLVAPLALEVMLFNLATNGHCSAMMKHLVACCLG